MADHRSQEGQVSSTCVINFWISRNLIKSSDCTNWNEAMQTWKEEKVGTLDWSWICGSDSVLLQSRSIVVHDHRAKNVGSKLYSFLGLHFLEFLGMFSQIIAPCSTKCTNDIVQRLIVCRICVPPSTFFRKEKHISQLFL